MRCGRRHPSHSRDYLRFLVSPLELHLTNARPSSACIFSWRSILKKHHKLALIKRFFLDPSLVVKYYYKKIKTENHNLQMLTLLKILLENEVWWKWEIIKRRVIFRRTFIIAPTPHTKLSQILHLYFKTLALSTSFTTWFDSKLLFLNYVSR